MRDAVIVDAVRTPVGKAKSPGKDKPGGQHAGTHPVELLAGTLSALAERTGIDPAGLDDVIGGGCVDQVGEQAMNTTRWAVLAAGFPRVRARHHGGPAVRLLPAGHPLRRAGSHVPAPTTW